MPGLKGSQQLAQSARVQGKGLAQGPDDWKWSSFRHYARQAVGVVEIVKWTARDKDRLAKGGAQRISLGPRLARKSRSRTWATRRVD